MLVEFGKYYVIKVPRDDVDCLRVPALWFTNDVMKISTAILYDVVSCNLQSQFVHLVSDRSNVGEEDTRQSQFVLASLHPR